MAWPPDEWQTAPDRPIAPEELPGTMPAVAQVPVEPAGIAWPPPEWMPSQEGARGLERMAMGAPEAQIQEVAPLEIGLEALPPKGLLTPRAPGIEPDEPPPSAVEMPVEPTREEIAAEVERYRTMAPEEYGAEQILTADARDRLSAERQLQELRSTRQEMEANAEDAEAARGRTREQLGRIQERSEELLSRDVDPGRWWASRSTGQKVASYLSAAIGGLLAPGQGGRNAPLDMIMGFIDRDIDAQKASFQQRRAALTDMRTTALQGAALDQDAFEAAEAKRLASYGMLQQQLAAERAKFDPMGTTAQRIASMERDLAGRQAAAAAAAEKEAFERQLALSKEQREWAKVKPRGGAGGGGRLRRPEQAVEYPQELRELAAAGPEGKKRADFIFSRMIVDPVTGKPSRRGDGSFLTSASPTVAESLNEAGAMIASANSMVNQAVALRGKHGWEPTSDWWSSEAGKRMASLSTEMLLLNKDVYQLGVLSESDERLLRKIQGGDLAGLQDPRPALVDMRQRMIDEYNQRRKSMAQGAEPVEFAITTTPPRATLRNVNVLLEQGPNKRTGDVPAAAERLGAANEKLDLLIEAEGGNIARASQRFVTESVVTQKKATAHLAELDDQWEDAKPDNYNDLLAAQGAAIATRLRLHGRGDATGEEINVADADVKKAARALENALSPRAKRIRASLEEQQQYVTGLDELIGGEAQRQAEAKQVRQREVERGRQAVETFEAGDVPTGARGAF
jgi:hypothetical protein